MESHETVYQNSFIERAKILFSELSTLSVSQRIEILNTLRRLLHTHSPFKSEPVDCVVWIPTDQVSANDYNPNTVAPPEMRLLELSIEQDGFTQPVVGWQTENGAFEVVDGFHRNRVVRESKLIRKRLNGYLPLSIINENRANRSDRIASTIRHNRARGKHRVDAMTDIVLELRRRNWSNKKIGRQLGMDPDEILRLTQIGGLAEMFSDRDFSEAWEAELLPDPETTPDP